MTIHVIIKHYLYRHFSNDKELLYIGITANEEKRRKKHNSEFSWAKQIAFTEITEFDDKLSAAIAEKDAIIAEKPRFNVEYQRSLSKKSAANLQRARRERMRARGYVLRHLWIHPDDWNEIKTLSNKKRDSMDP